MLINPNTQLGLRFRNGKVKSDCLKLTVAAYHKDMDEIDRNKDLVSHLREQVRVLDFNKDFMTQEEFDGKMQELHIIADTIPKTGSDKHPLTTEALIEAMTDEDSKMFLICESVYRASELIKVSENFTGRALKDIDFGKYTYLMGKHRFLRFVVSVGCVRGWYFDELKGIGMPFVVDIDSGEYSFVGPFDVEFTMVMRIMSFIELGDIEVVELKGGRNNGKPRQAGKITNESKNTVYVVDSSWNQIIMRTTGFAVRGFYRYQPCGEGHRDRKLKWIPAFEKHGYTRKAKASILEHS